MSRKFRPNEKFTISSLVEPSLGSIWLTFELWAFKKSSDISLITTAVGGNRCISAFATRLLPAPPCRHRPIRICVARSSRLSNGSREIKLMRMRRLSSITSGCFSDDNNVRSNDSKCGCTSDRFSVDFSISSMVHIAFERKRQSYTWKYNRYKLKTHGRVYNSFCECF